MRTAYNHLTYYFDVSCVHAFVCIPPTRALFFMDFDWSGQKINCSPDKIGRKNVFVLFSQRWPFILFFFISKCC